ncbi:MAG: response regulator [Clostridia bacterium]|nr:response regulator [Clostridia bacterium]
MYKLLIADDEKIVLDSIKFIIEKNFENINVVAAVRSGREAIELAETLRPDIIFMDIKMPGINGIEAIKEIKSRYSNAQFVVLTAYDQFDFAKEAVALGVFEYLLKPVNRSKIIETVGKMMEVIEEDRTKRKKELKLLERMENVYPVLESAFIHSIVFFNDDKIDIESYMSIFEITDDYGYIMTVELKEHQEPTSKGAGIGLSIRSQELYTYFRDTVKLCCKCIVGPLMLNRIVVFIPANPKNDEYATRVKALNIAQNTLTKLSEKGNPNFYIGIGKCYKWAENLSRSYEESLRAIKLAEEIGVTHIMDIPLSLENTSFLEYPHAKEKILLEKIALADTISCIQVFNHLFEWLTSEYKGCVQKMKGKLAEIIVLMYRTACDYGVKDDEVLKRQDYIIEMFGINEAVLLKNWFKDRIEYICRSIANIKTARVSGIILDAKDYIDKNFTKDITLEDIAREVNISPHYFSRLFKEETGVNFIDYLTLTRMHRAKCFLEDEAFSIKEICYKVGYGDPNYFSRAFKRVVGFSPTEYRENILNK